MFRGENIKPTAADVGLIHEARLILDAETVERDRSIFRGEGRRIAARVEGAGRSRWVTARAHSARAFLRSQGG